MRCPNWIAEAFASAKGPDVHDRDIAPGPVVLRNANAEYLMAVGWPVEVNDDGRWVIREDLHALWVACEKVERHHVRENGGIRLVMRKVSPRLDEGRAVYRLGGSAYDWVCSVWLGD